jgi:hypothetical protein
MSATHRYAAQSIRVGWEVWLAATMAWVTVTDVRVAPSTFRAGSDVHIAHDRGVSTFPAGTVLLVRRG